MAAIEPCCVENSLQEGRRGEDEVIVKVDDDDDDETRKEVQCTDAEGSGANLLSLREGKGFVRV